MTEQEGFAIGLLLKPFVSLVILIPVVLLGRWILTKLPEGKLKALLSRRVGP